MEALRGLASYQVRVGWIEPAQHSTKGQIVFRRVLFDAVGSGTSVRVGQSLAPGRRYWWQVLGLRADGAAITSSSVWSFTTSATGAAIFSP